MQKLRMLFFMACAASTAAQAQESGTETEYKDFIELFAGIAHDDG